MRRAGLAARRIVCGASSCVRDRFWVEARSFEQLVADPLHRRGALGQRELALRHPLGELGGVAVFGCAPCHLTGRPGKLRRWRRLGVELRRGRARARTSAARRGRARAHRRWRPARSPGATCPAACGTSRMRRRLAPFEWPPHRVARAEVVAHLDGGVAPLGDAPLAHLVTPTVHHVASARAAAPALFSRARARARNCR